MPTSKPIREVTRIDRSPMNPLRWCLELTCGHEVWMTAKSRPKQQMAHCPDCAREPDAAK